MGKIDSFIVTITDGKIGFKSTYHRSLFDRFVRSFKDGQYRLSIEDIKEKRSYQQNRYYWLYLGIVSEDTGYTPEELHEWARSKFLTKQVVEIFGNKVRSRTSTTKLSKGEFVEYLMKIARETEIPLPDTTAYFGYSYHK